MAWASVSGGHSEQLLATREDPHGDEAFRDAESIGDESGAAWRTCRAPDTVANRCCDDLGCERRYHERVGIDTASSETVGGVTVE